MAPYVAVFFSSHAFIVESLSKYKQGIFLHITTVTKYKMENYRGYMYIIIIFIYIHIYIFLNIFDFNQAPFNPPGGNK